ncbi:Fe-S cluster assembly scaffold protein NifU [bacterium]|nr:Fe-S cluster assembly scaffold protein NifU [bacterium]
MYSEKVMDHFQNPRNVGSLKEADGIGEVGNPVCGDVMTFYIKVKDNRIQDVKFQTFGCGAAIAVSSIVSEIAKGQTLPEAMKITNKKIAQELGGLPKNKFHCSNLGAEALHKAIQNYREKYHACIHPKSDKWECYCPYCESFLTGDIKKFCHNCQVEFKDCPECGKPRQKNRERCPHCGASAVNL